VPVESSADDRVPSHNSLFEGMKAYKTMAADSKPLLFRPDMNMARMRRSADRVQLPVSSLDRFLV
jgi:branched-chain amino acid aminotransferase